MQVKTILIVDKGLGLVLWLGHILNTGGTVALPATNIADAAELVSMLSLRVDVLIASPGEDGVQEFVEDLCLSSPDLQMVALGDEEDSAWAMTLPGAVWKPRPQCGDEATSTEWMDLIDELDRSRLSLASQG